MLIDHEKLKVNVKMSDHVKDGEITRENIYLYF